MKHIAFVLMLSALADIAAGQEANGGNVDWAYASYFGTGWYRVSDDRDVYVFEAQPRWRLREPSLEGGEREMGLELRLPVSIGLNDFGLDDPIGVIDTGNLASLSVTPGIDVIIPVTKRRMLRPHAAVGWGTLLGENESAWTYWAGIRSRFEFGDPVFSWSLLAAAAYVGSSPDGEPSQQFLPVMTGVEFEHAREGWKLGDDAMFLAWHVTYTRFLDDFDLVSPTGLTSSIPDQWEVGIAIGKVDRKLELGWFRFERIGVAYRASSSGELRGIGLIFRSVFDR